MALILLKSSEVIGKLTETEQNILNGLKTQQTQDCANVVEKALEVQSKIVNQQISEVVEVNKQLALAESQVMLKLAEIGHLREQLERKNEEIIEKNEKIKKLTEKNEILSANSGIYK